MTSSDYLTCADCLRPKSARHRRLYIVAILDGEKLHVRHQLSSPLCGHPASSARSARGLLTKFRCFPSRTPHRHMKLFLSCDDTSFPTGASRVVRSSPKFWHRDRSLCWLPFLGRSRAQYLTCHSLPFMRWHEEIGDCVVRWICPEEGHGSPGTGPWTGSRGAPFGSDNDSSGIACLQPKVKSRWMAAECI